MKRLIAVFAALAFLGCILAANYATTHYGGKDHLVPIFGLPVMATAGTYFAGLTFVLRDSLQDLGGRRFVVVLIAVGAGLSFAISAPFIALASGVAFLVSELADFAIYTPLRDRGYLRAAIASNAVGAFVDTILFLWIAGFPIWSAVPGQMVGKMGVTALVVVGVLAVRGVSRWSTSRTPAATK